MTDRKDTWSLVRDRSKPKHQFTNIRSRPDGSYVVTLKIPAMLEPVDYHVMHPKHDSQAPEGLYAQVLAEIKAGAKVSTWVNEVPAQVVDPTLALASQKANADRVIGLLQYEYDVAETEEQPHLHVSLLAWKRYRVQLEKDSAAAVQPDKPAWIT